MKKYKMILFLIIVVIVPISIYAKESSAKCYDVAPAFPEIGEHPSYVENNDYFIITNQYWKNLTDDKIMEPFDIFEENKKYYYNLEVEYNKQYEIAICVNNFINSPYSLGGGSTS